MAMDFHPAEYFDPREYLLDELRARGLTVDGCIGTIRRWYHSEDAMSGRVAWCIAVMFQQVPAASGAQLWLNLDAAWQSRPKDPAPGLTE
jgi:hypothetical protein